MLKSINECRVCKNKNLIKVLDLGEQFLTGVFPKSIDQKISKGPLQLLKCHDNSNSKNICGLLQISHDYDLSEMYGDDYGYRSGLNESMVKHLHEKVSQILEIIALSDGDLVVDIGSNDSTTLQAYPSRKYELVGIDPTGKKFSKFYPSHIKLIPEFFSLKNFNKFYNNKKAKIITSFSMLYDLDDPLKFMKDIKQILCKDGVWVFEQSYMPSMLELNSYDTVCHEHKEYYGLHQIKWMTDKVGFKIIDIKFNKINGGSFSITVAHKNSNFEVSDILEAVLAEEKDKLLNTLDPYLKFSKRVKKLKLNFLKFIKKAKLEKKIIGALGASTKGNVILQYCGITNKDIHFVGEVNSDKFNHYTPGSYLPIIPEDIVLEKNPDYLIVLPWHFKDFFLNHKKFDKTKLVFPLPEITFSI
jgi:hypothetical protein